MILGIAIWLGMTLLNTTVATLQIVGCAVLWAASWWRHPGDQDRAVAWRVAVLALASTLASLLMPAFVSAWPRLPARLAYALNTPDDQDPAWQGTFEPQVAWVQEHCGDLWRRVYWLTRNSVYGLAVLLRPLRPNFDTVNYGIAGNVLVATWSDPVAPGVVKMEHLVERVWPLHIGPRWLVIYFGWRLRAYVNSPLYKLEKNPKPELDDTRDTGGIPELTARLMAYNPLEP